jgi:tetratricopeptide (TPR) repeat protein
MPRAQRSVQDVTRSAALLMKKNQWRRALKLMDTVPPGKRTNELWWNHGWALGKLGDWKGAVGSLAAAVRVKPKSAVSLWALGLAHSEAGHPKLAERYHLAAIALKDSSLARLTLAVHYMLQRNFDAAERIHREGIALRPRSRRRLEQYANFLWDVGRRDESRAVTRRARKLPKPTKRPKRTNRKV